MVLLVRTILWKTVCCHDATANSSVTKVRVDVSSHLYAVAVKATIFAECAV
jgi:hypothetical protein